MSLKYADLCVRCGKRMTQHPSKMCATCRRAVESIKNKENKAAAKAERKTICKQCGRRIATDETGICQICRASHTKMATNYEEKLGKAIMKAKTKVFILERRLEGNSFATIAEMYDVPVSWVHKVYMDAMGMKKARTFTDYVDETEYLPEEETTPAAEKTQQ